MDNKLRRIESDQLQPAIDLLEKGLYLQAFNFSLRWGLPQTWHGSEALLFAGRLVSHLGATSLSDWLLRRAWRENPSSAEAQYYYAYVLLRKWGPYSALQWMQKHPVLPGNPTEDIQVSWYTLFGTSLGILRDFDTAERWYRRANEIAPKSAWAKVCQSHLLERQDKYEEALKIARDALEIHPFYRPAVQSAAYLLTLLDRDEEALQLLSDASQCLESSIVSSQLYSLQMELKLYGPARKSLERFVELTPLADKHTLKWLTIQRSEIAYREGDIEGAKHHANLSGNNFLKTISAHLEDSSRADRRAVLLPVGFVRQHHMTCAPATLSAISHYWSMPANHLQVADEICYNGTSSYSERKWAQENGWAVKEFTITEASAASLLDRGIPFTFTTVEPSSRHLQAVIGYDGRRGTLVIRDPFWRHSAEAVTEEVCKRYKAYGPRGMALVPEADVEQLDGIDLPDVHLWDRLHELDRALVAHQRAEAQEIYQQIQDTADGHVLACHARRRLAIYDCNPTEQLAAVELLLEFASDDQVLQLERLDLLRDLAHRQERLEIYRMLCSKKEAHPIFWQQYAHELQADARRHDDAIWLLHRAIRRWPTEASNYFILAKIYWDQRKFDESFNLYRFAACLDDKNESFAHAYFTASIWRKQTELTLNFLRDRFERFGEKSSFPARTLFSAYLQLDRSREGLEVVERALSMQPDDGELLLFAAEAYLSCSTENMARAEEFLGQAEGKCSQSEWFRVAAKIASSDGRPSDALEYWKQVIDIQPLAIDAHTAVAQLLAETQGMERSCEHLEEAVHRFPHHYPLQELRAQWTRHVSREVREKVIRQAIEETPDNAWLHRELALLLADQRCFEEAWQQMDIAGQLDPTNTNYFWAQAHLFDSEGKIDEAKESLRQAILLSVDNYSAIARWIELCESADERREVLAFVKEQLIKQVIFGEGLREFRAHACEALEPEELLSLLREGLKARPDLWHAWEATIMQMLDMKELEEAEQLARQATDRFPLLPVLWLARASVHGARGESEAELAALKTAYQIKPDWGESVRALGEWYNRSGDYQKAKKLLEKATARTPLEIPNHIFLAQTLWSLDEHEAALNRIHHAVKLNPGYGYAWGLLNEWTEQLGCPERALETARELTQQRPDEVRSWMILARLLDAPEQLEERLEVLDRVMGLNRWFQEAHDLRAQSLAHSGRWVEARQACFPPEWGDNPPILLRARAAWVDAQEGNLKEAIAGMQEVVRQDPFFFQAWSWLADWYCRTECYSDYLAAAEMLIRLRPHYEGGYGCLGEAKLIQGDRAGAIDAFRHAFELSPSYEFAGEYLFDLQLEDGNTSDAAETISILRTHINNAFVAAREVQLAARRDEIEAAAEALSRTCVTASESTWPVTAGIEAMLSVGWQKAVKHILDRVLSNENVHPQVGAEWIKLCISQGDWKCSSRLAGLIEQGEVGLKAMEAYIDALVQYYFKSHLRQFLDNNRSLLQKSTFAWGSAGYGLIAMREYKPAARWHADWGKRPDATPWMLLNAVEAFRALKRDSEAAEASRTALTKPEKEFQPHHHAWLAFDEICSGNIEAANQHLEKAASESFNDHYRFLITIVKCVVKIAGTSQADSGQVFRKVKLLMKHARFTYHDYGAEPARRRAYRRCLKEIARYRKGTMAKLWFWSNWIKSYLGFIPGAKIEY